MDIKGQGYFGLQVIVNVNQELKDHQQVSALKNLASGYAQEIVDFRERVHSKIIPKAI